MDHDASIRMSNNSSPKIPMRRKKRHANLSPAAAVMVPALDADVTEFAVPGAASDSAVDCHHSDASACCSLCSCGVVSECPSACRQDQAPFEDNTLNDNERSKKDQDLSFIDECEKVHVHSNENEQDLITEAEAATTSKGSSMMGSIASVLNATPKRRRPNHSAIASDHEQVIPQHLLRQQLHSRLVSTFPVTTAIAVNETTSTQQSQRTLIKSRKKGKQTNDDIETIVHSSHLEQQQQAQSLFTSNSKAAASMIQTPPRTEKNYHTDFVRQYQTRAHSPQSSSSFTVAAEIHQSHTTPQRPTTRATAAAAATATITNSTKSTKDLLKQKKYLNSSKVESALFSPKPIYTRTKWKTAKNDPTAASESSDSIINTLNITAPITAPRRISQLPPRSASSVRNSSATVTSPNEQFTAESSTINITNSSTLVVERECAFSSNGDSYIDSNDNNNSCNTTIYNNTILSSSSGGYDSSPTATPFRFHSFPASLPRVDPRSRTATSGDAYDGGGRSSNTPFSIFSSTPFRLDVSLDPKSCGSGSNSSSSHSGSYSGDREHYKLQENDNEEDRRRGSKTVAEGTKRLPPLRPRPFSISVEKREDNPLDEAVMSLKEPAITGAIPMTKNCETMISLSTDELGRMLPLSPSFDATEDQNNVSGDWSEATSMNFMNERMKMASVNMVIPTHVTAQGLTFSEEWKEDQKEEKEQIEAELNTVMEDEKDESDTEEEEGYIDVRLGYSKNNANLPLDRVTLTANTGTKLNFNSLFSPPQSSKLSSRSVPKCSSIQSTFESTLHPHTPRSAAAEKFHIHSLEVSPIVGLPDDDDNQILDGEILMKGCLDEEKTLKEREVREGALLQQQFQNKSSPITNINLAHDNEADTSAASSTTVFSAGNTTATSSSNINGYTNVSNSSSTTRAQTRKMRPMPDTSAFDVCTPSNQSIRSKDSGANSHKTSAFDRLLCPPTPIRTPAWAHVDSGRPTLQRANSLISTKVLAACPPRILDSLSSLEDSMLENDISGSTMDVDSHPMQNSSFAPVQEKEEDDSFEAEDRPVAEGCLFQSENFIEQVSPLQEEHLERKSSCNAMEGQNELAKEGEISKKRSSVGRDMALDTIVSFSTDFDNFGILGSGAFADVYKVRSKRDHLFYAIKRTRRQFRGVRDRERAMAEVQTMQRLQIASLSNDKSNTMTGITSKMSYGLYLLFFMRAWQEDGYFFCQTELCSRATCRQLRLSMTSEWERDVLKYPSLFMCLDSERDASSLNRLLPERAIWQVCHDISRGLFHIHSHGMVHYDIKPSNIFFVFNIRWGTICKIGDFGLAGDIGTTDDGQEGDTAYMPIELLSSCVKHPGADIFSLGLTLYEIAASVSWTLPREGGRWHELRSGSHIPELPSTRSESLVKLIQLMLQRTAKERPSAEQVSEHVQVASASAMSDSFLSQYVKDVERYDSFREKELESAEWEARRRSSTPVAPILSQGNDTLSRRQSFFSKNNDIKCAGTPTQDIQTPKCHK